LASLHEQKIKPVPGHSHELPDSNRIAAPSAVRVLLAEDNEIMAEATAEFLRSRGMEVRIARTGGDALTSAVAFQPHIILCDLRLPDMMGFDVARALRKSSAAGSILFVIHSAFTEADIGDIDVPEVDLVMSKPITQEKFETLIELSRQPRKPST